MFIKKIESALLEIIPDSNLEISDLITRTDDKSHGDFAFPCFSLAKEYHKAPALIAEELAKKINLGEEFQRCENIGPYLNFYVDQSYFNKYVLTKIFNENQKYGSSKTGLGKTCLLEHTSINPNASPHIGRARNAIIGDFVARIMRFEGYDVNVHYFVNDIGKQISMLVLGSEQLEDIRFDNLLDLYVSINQRVKDDPDLEKKVFELLYKLENGDPEVKKQFRRIVDICIAGQTKIFNELKIFYDCYDYESQFLFDNSLDKIVEQIRATGLLFEDEEGRYVVNLEKYQLSPLVITRGDKTSLYPLRDIAYTIWKCKKNNDKNIIILGQDQQLYFQQVAAIVEELGYKRPDVIHYAFVLLVEGKMSTRQGTVVLLEDFMKESVNKVNEGIIERETKGDLERAKKIGYSTVKYSMEKTSNGRNVVFDWDQALSFDGDTASYLLYSYARINSIISKLEIEPSVAIDFANLTHYSEVDLIDALYRFPSIVKKALQEYSPHIITHYSFELAKKFSVFYHDCSILNAETEELKGARLTLIKAVKQVLENAFFILGLEAVEHM